MRSAGSGQLAAADSSAIHVDIFAVIRIIHIVYDVIFSA
jgi:hypothetical protein